MSAAAKSWKVQDHQDRRTNMVTSSIKQPAKKDGAGGCYTWGSASDVADLGLISAPPIAKGVTVVPAAAPATVVTTQQAPAVSISDAQQFPSLGSQPAASPVTSMRWSTPAPTVYQAPVTVPPTTVTTKVVAAAPVQPSSVNIPPTSSPATTVSSTVTTAGTSPVAAGAPRVILGEDMLRAGVPALDATHPRNAFARKPHHKPFAGTAPAVQVQEAPAIDWTAAGTTAFQQQVIHAVAQNPAHLGPYAEAKPMPAMSVLRATPSPAAYIPNQKLSKQVAAQPKIAKPQVMFMR
eukprot:CAMPEP_0175282558 /NCGR_PEP_ID=MMETSP0093-20121207/51697_1 /TAXON_ID=311494 /ORGANISM="Alexandrium monilatum, Strain CCMP3105" /LENGTH=292 /DNA_ID=CAMNT_0016577771 /DNA_START=7 /DNA_END=882 /DNA_ORIENTATION=-